MIGKHHHHHHIRLMSDLAHFYILISTDTTRVQLLQQIDANTVEGVWFADSSWLDSGDFDGACIPGNCSVRLATGRFTEVRERDFVTTYKSHTTAEQ